MTTEEQTRCKIRLVETFYQNRIEWEDGPGSCQNIVSDSSTRRRDLGSMTVAEARILGKSNVEEILGTYFEEDSADGFEEYSYMLEYLDPTTETWHLVGFLH